MKNRTVAAVIPGHASVELVRFANESGMSVSGIIANLVCDFLGKELRPPQTRFGCSGIRIEETAKLPPIPDPLANPVQTPEQIARDYATRGFHKNYIAARTRLPWAKVESIMAEVRQRQKMEADIDC